MKLQNNNIIIEIDDKTGVTTGIYQTGDTYDMNWVYNDLVWGVPEGFETKSVEPGENSVVCSFQSLAPNSLPFHSEMTGLEMVIEKSLTDKGYSEKYTIKNTNDSEFFLTKENFGIPYPYQCNNYTAKDTFHIFSNRCINHVWCGGNVCWIYSVRCNGQAPYLVMETKEGSVEDYSISYDISKTNSNSSYRGAIVLHPTECIIQPGESKVYEFVYNFSDTKPDEMLTENTCMRFVSDRYTYTPGEKINLFLESAKAWNEAVIVADGEVFELEKGVNNASVVCSFKEFGPKKITATVDGKTTWVTVNIMPSIDETLEKRAHFIAEKQQYHCPGSHIDGAYLVYDDETKSVYYRNGENDHNASRERFAMGLIVLLQLQKKYDQKLMDSIEKHKAFIERELLDKETGMVYGDVCHKNNHLRIYNLPWLSDYYLEWYRLTGEAEYIEIAAKIMIRYYEFGNFTQDSQCIEAVRIAEDLEKEGLLELRQKFLDLFLTHANSILDPNRTGTSDEVIYAQEWPNCVCAYLCQAYLITGDKKYLDGAHKYEAMSHSFHASQPDFHLNCGTVRYWDRYWFGKRRQTGDLFPHYWSILTSWAYYWYDKASGHNMHEIAIKNNVGSNLSVYREDGFAANNYLYPYKVTMYSSDPTFTHRHLKVGTYWGKNYDAWANDQDWALYYAVICM